MPNTFKISCSHCGHTLQVDDRAVGKEIRCQRCGERFPVAPPAPESISVTCTCGRTYKVPASKAGKRGKCHACGAALLIPAIQLSALPEVVIEYDEAQQQEEIAGTSTNRVAVIAGAVALLIGISLTAFWLGRSTSVPAPIAQAPAPVRRTTLPAVERPIPQVVDHSSRPASPIPQPVAVVPQRPVSPTPRVFAPTTRADLSAQAAVAPDPSAAPVIADIQAPTSQPVSLGEVDEQGRPIGKPRELWRLQDEKGLIAVAFAPNGKLMAITGSNGLTIREVPSGKIVQILNTIKYPNSVCFSPDSSHVLWNKTTDRITLYSELKTGRDLQRFSSPNAYMSAIGISPDGKLAAVASGDNYVRIWDIESGSLRSTLIAEPPFVAYEIAFSPDSRQIITGGYNKGLHLWDVTTGKDLRRFVGHKGEVRAIAFLPDGKSFLSGGGDRIQKDGRWIFDGDNDIHWWNLDSGQEIKRLTGHKNWVQELAISSNGQYLISGGGMNISSIDRQSVKSEDNTIRVWKLSTGQEFQVFRGHGQSVASLAVSPDGHYALSGSADRTARLWLLPDEVWEDRPADAVVISERRNMPAISRRISGEAAALIEAKKWDEAVALLQEVEIDLSELAEQNNLPLWDTTISPIFRLIESKRASIQTKRAQSNDPAATRPAATRPGVRLTAEQNRELGDIRMALGQVETMIREKKLVQAQSAVYKVQDELKRYTQTKQVPEWITPVAVLFQTAAKRQDEIEEARMAEAAKGQAVVAAAKTPQKAQVPQPQPAAVTQGQGLQPGQPAPGFTALTLDGGQFATQQFKGKYVLLDFWATWCGPCKAEMPNLADVYQTYGKDKRFVLISLSMDSQIQTPAQYAAQNGMTWVQGFLGANSPVTQMYQVHGIPAIMLIGPDGKIIATRLRGENIKKTVGEVLAAKPSR